MKREHFILIVILLILTGCGGSKRPFNESEGIITIDVSINYPPKELMLQDFMDVEYIALETNDDFLCQGIVLAVGRDVMIVRNQINDGDLFIFDRNGKALHKFNRKGQGGEEYTGIPGITLDEDNGEIYASTNNKMLVYNFFGNFKRSFLYPDGSMYGNFRNFDSENLICHDLSFGNEGVTDKSPFVILSKLDGSITKDIQIVNQYKMPELVKVNHNGMILTGYGSVSSPVPLIPYQGAWILSVYSSDTVFKYMTDHGMIPFMIRTPSVETPKSDSYFAPVLLTGRYYFLQTQKKEPEARGTTLDDAVLFYPKTYLVYDRQEKAIFEYKVFNNDYANKITVNFMEQRTGHEEIAFWQKIEAYQLKEDYENGQLKGSKLKEIAAKLDAEDNPVIMLVKHKKI